MKPRRPNRAEAAALLIGVFGILYTVTYTVYCIRTGAWGAASTSARDSWVGAVVMSAAPR